MPSLSSISEDSSISDELSDKSSKLSLTKSTGSIDYNLFNKFALKLYNKLAQPNENLIFSPFSISTVLSMILAGAGTNSLKELKELLDFDDLSIDDINLMNNEYLLLFKKLNNSNLEMQSAYKLFICKENITLKDEYKSSMANNYFSDIEFFDAAQSAEKINKSDQMNNKIKEMIDPNRSDEAKCLMLINALHFKGKFSMSFSEKILFNVNRTFKTEVNFMHVIDIFYMHLNPLGLKAKICELPFNCDVSMTIILPDKYVDIKRIESKLTIDLITQILKTGELKKVSLHVPKFKMKKDYNVFYAFFIKF